MPPHLVVHGQGTPYPQASFLFLSLLFLDLSFFLSFFLVSLFSLSFFLSVFSSFLTSLHLHFHSLPSQKSRLFCFSIVSVFISFLGVLTLPESRANNPSIDLIDALGL